MQTALKPIGFKASFVYGNTLNHKYAMSHFAFLCYNVFYLILFCRTVPPEPVQKST
mgnify:CR=1 FL=1